MIIFPAMDLFNGQVVKLEAGRHREIEKIYGAPAEIADRWLGAGAKWIHVVDLNATLGVGAPNRDVLRVLVPKAGKAGAKIQWGGGVRDTASLKGLLDAGADAVVAGTKAVRDRRWLRRVAERHPGRIVVAIDAAGRDILVGGWQEKAGMDAVEFARRSGDLPIAAFLYTNVKVEGRGRGVDWGPIEEVVRASPKPVIFSGGITSLEEVGRFKELKAHGIIVGAALYSGRIGFAEARSVAR